MKCEKQQVDFAPWRRNLNRLAVFGCCALLFGAVSGTVSAQTTGKATTEKSGKRMFRGQVVEAGNGDPVIGATVQLKKNKSVITATDSDGYFSIQADPNDVLIIKFLGMQTVEVEARLAAQVQMSEETKSLDEVVVVGAGTQRKISVSGAITSIKGESLRMPSSSLTTAFAGQLAGVISSTTSGAPGSAAEFYIRGVSTFGGRTTPLIMLDDVEISVQDLNNVPAETIESVSVLKDASATAIYGSRGANGVMVIKTKSGRENERTKINMTFEQSFNAPMRFPQFVDGATWMELYNEAQLARNPNARLRYSQERIENTRKGVNPYVFPDVDWKDVIFRDFATSQRANINVQGGGSKATYYMSVQLNHDTGILNSHKAYSWNNNIDNTALNFQNNISYKLTPSTKIDLRMNAQVRSFKGGNYDPAGLFAKMQAANPINFPTIFPAQEGDKHIRFGSSVLTGNTYRENIYATMLNSFQERRENKINISLKLMQELNFITKGLSTSFLANFNNWSQDKYNRSIAPYLYGVKDGSYNAADNTYEIERLGTSGADYITESQLERASDQTTFLQGTLDYNRRFGDHNVGGMLLYQQREFRNSILPRRNQGLSARVTYSFMDRYLAEFNAGYTGTERLAKGSRFEFFPALSLGWIVSEEKFFEPLKKHIHSLKLRTSYGLIGSDETGSEAGHYLYIDRVSLEHDQMGYTTGETLGYTQKGPNVAQYAVVGARWEKARKFNVGIDLKLLDGLDITADYFYDKRYDILLKREAWPQSLGYHEAKPYSNKGRVDNSGFEFSANYTRQFAKDLEVSFRVNYTQTKNKYVDVDDPKYYYTWKDRTGQPLNVTNGYISDGLFTSQEEIDNSPIQNLGSTPRPGDIKYRDITGDGLITEDDQTVISEYGGRPRIQYGFGTTVRYKKFDFGVFFTGSAKRTIMTGLMAPFGQNDQNVFQFIADNRWNEAKPDANALYPRLGLLSSDTDNNRFASTYWMRNGNFLRFKQLELGYNFSKGRVYITGDNIAVFSKFKEWDPELAWNSYPLQRTFNVGVQLRF